MVPMLAVLAPLFFCTASPEAAVAGLHAYAAAPQPVVILKASVFPGDAPFAEQTTAATIASDHVTHPDHPDFEPPRAAPRVTRNVFLVFPTVNHRWVRHPLHEASLPPPCCG